MFVFFPLQVLLATEEFHAAAGAKKNNEEVRKPPTTTAATLKQARERAIAAVAATDPTGSMLRKWEREGDSAEDKLRRLESRLAAKGLISVDSEPFTKEAMGKRQKSLQGKLGPSSRRSMNELRQNNIMRGRSSIQAAQQGLMKKKLNQRLKYRPNQDDLVKGGILRPGASGRAYGSRAV